MTRNLTTTSNLTDLLFDATQDAAAQLIAAIQNNEQEQEIARLHRVLSVNMEAFQQAMREAAPWSEDGWHLPVGITPDMLDNPGVDPYTAPVEPITILRSIGMTC